MVCKKFNADFAGHFTLKSAIMSYVELSMKKKEKRDLT